MTKVILIQGSLRTHSYTDIAIKRAAKHLKKLGVTHEIVDLRDYKMPFCDGREPDQYPEEVLKMQAKLEKAKAFIFGMPVYCYSVSGPLKNFIDIHSRAFEKKYSGILAISGSERSYLAPAELAKILAYESSCITLLPTVSISRTDFMGDTIDNKIVKKKLKGMLEEIKKRV